MREDEKRPEVPDIGSREDDELSQYGDEQDVPVRRRRRSGKTAAKAKTGKKKKASAKRRARARAERSGVRSLSGCFPALPSARRGAGARCACSGAKYTSPSGRCFWWASRFCWR